MTDKEDDESKSSSTVEKYERRGSRAPRGHLRPGAQAQRGHGGRDGGRPEAARGGEGKDEDEKERSCSAAASLQHPHPGASPSARPPPRPPQSARPRAQRAQCGVGDLSDKTTKQGKHNLPPGWMSQGAAGCRYGQGSDGDGRRAARPPGGARARSPIQSRRRRRAGHAAATRRPGGQLGWPEVPPRATRAETLPPPKPGPNPRTVRFQQPPTRPQGQPPGTSAARRELWDGRREKGVKAC